MKVFHFTSSHRAGPHGTDVLSRDYFYVLEEGCILFSQRQGVFDDRHYSITKNRGLIDQARLLMNGDETLDDGVQYSAGKEFDYDTDALQDLIEEASREKTSRQKLEIGITDLLIKSGQLKEESIDYIDPETLDPETRQRLESLVDAYVKNDFMKARIYAGLEVESALQATREAEENRLKQRLEEVKSGRVKTGPDVLHIYMYQATAAGVDDIAREFAQLIYHGLSSYEEKMDAAELLGRPEEEIIKLKEEHLFAVMTNNNRDDDFIKMVEKEINDLPEETVKRIAQEAYTKLIGTQISGGEFSFLQAAQIAKKYLGEEQLRDAGESLVLAVSLKRAANLYDWIGRKIAELELPDNMDRSLMLDMFEVSLLYDPEEAAEIVQRYGFTDDEMWYRVNKAYVEAVDNGRFEIVSRILEMYGNLVSDDRVSYEDAKTLARIMNFEKEQARQVSRRNREYSNI